MANISLFCLVLLFCMHGSQCFTLANFGALNDVHRWVQDAHDSANLLDNDLAKSVPYIIVAGDQGVGKSTTINRIVRAEIFPMRSKEQADKDEPQTKVATLYHVRQSAHSNGSVARVSAQPKTKKDMNSWLSLPKDVDCSPQMVELSKLGKKITGLQNTCFPDNFDLDATITVEYESPKALDISIVDLPGIQQSGADANKTHLLSRKWLERYENSIVLAVLVAERQFQQSIVGILQEKPSLYRDRTILVVTKPHSIPQTSHKILNMIGGENVQDICKGRAVMLRSADTSDAQEENLTIKTQEEKEQEWFKTHPLYAPRIHLWGIQTLIGLAQDMYLQRACAQIPEMQKAISERLKNDVKQLKSLPDISSEDVVFWDMVQNWREFLEEEVTIGYASTALTTIYSEFLQNRATFERASNRVSGLPRFGMPYFSSKDPFFVKWLEFSHDLLAQIRDEMLLAAIRAGEKAIEKSIGKSQEGYNFQDVAAWLAPLVACDDAPLTIKRLVHSHCFETSSSATLDSPDALNNFLEGLKKQMPAVILRMAIQLCVWEPIRDLQSQVRMTEHGALYQMIVQALDATALRRKREQIASRVDAYKRLLGKRFVCAGASLVRKGSTNAPLQKGEDEPNVTLDW